MRQKTRDGDERILPLDPEGDPDGETLETMRRDGERALSAGDEIIRNALSGNSAAFLRNSRQQGGQ